MRYVIRQDRRSLALRGLHEMTLRAAQAAVVVGGASPAAAVAEIQHVLARLVAAGWTTRTRPSVVGDASISERPAGRDET